MPHCAPSTEENAIANYKDVIAMPKFMKIESALSRVVEDDEAPAKMRFEALQQIEKPNVMMLRRILVRSKTNPVKRPSKLLALAALKYADAMRGRALRVAHKKRAATRGKSPLGI
jgi:hypothetical protein